MAFQFLCPQGHLLQGDESLVGQQCQCPYCGSLFLVPQPVPPAAPQEAPYQPPVWEPSPGVGPASTAPEGFPGVRTVPDFTGATGTVEPVDPLALPGGAKQFVVHILCPSGHQLETPREMLGQDAMCPYCQVQFRLRYENSLEYRQERAEALERQERKAAKLWLNWAIGIAVVVVLGVITLIAIAASWQW